MATKQTEEQHLDPEMAPDPDEDDLSDLDDMLDEFSSAKISASKPATTPSTAAPTLPSVPKPAPQNDSLSDEDFAKQLQAGMAGLLGQLDNNSDMQKEFEEMMKDLSGKAEAGAGPEPLPSEPSANPEELSSEITAEFEKAMKAPGMQDMWAQLLSGFDAEAAAGALPTASIGPASTAPQLSASTNKKPAADSSFQDTIRKTMERMQNSGETASAAATAPGEDDILAQMLKEMEGGNFGGGSEEDMNKMLMGMMEQLTNKDILYDPMKELHDKFPAWLKDNKDKVSKEDLARYEEQQNVVGEIVARFERKQYSDDSNEDRAYIVEKMQKMQAAGSPPPDLVGDMSAAQEALGDLDGGCPQQ